MAKDKYGYPQNLWNTKHDRDLEGIILLIMDEGLDTHREYLAIKEDAIRDCDRAWQDFLDDKIFSSESLRYVYNDIAEQLIYDLHFFRNEQH